MDSSESEMSFQKEWKEKKNGVKHKPNQRHSQYEFK